MEFKIQKLKLFRSLAKDTVITRKKLLTLKSA